ncbi:MAG TPA: AAA family ATPase [Natronosporangium sp.]
MDIRHDTSDHRVDIDQIETRQQFAAALTAAREQAGLTVRQVARVTGIPAATLGGYFSGRHLPPISPSHILPAILRTCGIADPLTMERWWAALRRVRRSPGPRRSGAPVPYRGLDAFQPEDAAWFCGREELTRQILDLLAKRHAAGDGLVMLVGPSGSGKSSLLRAGLVATLRAGEVRWNGSLTGPVLLFTPGADPLRRLREQLGQLAVDQSPADARLVVLVDQFEQLFTADIEESVRDRFITELRRLARGEGRPAPALVVLALRADFYGHALAYPALATASQAGQVVVGPMTRDQLRSVIVEPARRAGVEVEEGLVEVMLRDIAPPGGARAHMAGALPLLSHALLVTWQHSRGARLTLAGYQDSGGLRGAVAKTAERVYAELAAADQELARQLFLRLVRVSPDGVDTARRVSHTALTTGADDTESAALRSVCERFVNSRLLTVDETSIQLAHETLLHAWPRLRSWVDTDRAGLVTGVRLAEAAEAWEWEHRDPAALYGGSRLAAARDWAAANRGKVPPLVDQFITASVRRERRRTRRLYQTIATLAALLGLALTTGAIALEQRSRAVSQQRLIANERDQALSRLVAGHAERLRDRDVSMAAQLSLAAYRIWPTEAARAALIDTSATPMATRLLGSAGVMQSLATTRDHRTLAAGSTDGTVLLWDISDPADPVRLGPPLTGPTDAVSSVAISPDGRTLAAGSADYLVHLWDITDPRQPVARPPLAGPADFVQAVTFSPSGRLLAAGSSDATVRLWRVSGDAAPEPLDPLTGPNRPVVSVAFSPDERTLVAGTRGSRLFLWDVSDPRRPVRFAEPLAGSTGWLLTTAFSPDGDTLAAGSADLVWLWDWRAARVIGVLPHPGPVTSLRWGGDERMLITTGADGTARIWHLPGPALPGHNPVNSVRFSPDGQLLAVAAGDTQLWRVADRTPLGPPMTNPTGFSGAVAFADSAQTLIVSDRAGRLHQWDITDPARPAPLGEPVEAHSQVIEQIALSPDGTLLATGADDNLVRLWDVADPSRPTLTAELRAFTNFVYSVLFDPTGKLVAGASVDSSVRLWDVRNPAQPVELGGPMISSQHYAISLAFHPNRPILAVGSGDTNIYLWDISDPHRPVRLGPPLVGAEDFVYALAFSPDGNTLAAANTDETLWLWDVTEPRDPAVLAILTAARDRLYTVTFSPDGRLLAAGGGGNAVWLWSMALDEIAAEICRTAGDILTVDEWRKYVPDLAYRPPC